MWTVWILQFSTSIEYSCTLKHWTIALRRSIQSSAHATHNLTRPYVTLGPYYSPLCLLLKYRCTYIYIIHTRRRTPTVQQLPSPNCQWTVEQLYTKNNIECTCQLKAACAYLLHALKRLISHCVIQLIKLRNKLSYITVLNSITLPHSESYL
jgi:hypothetical protein